MQTTQTQNIVPLWKNGQGVHDHASEKEQSLRAAWAFAHTVLWPNETFSEKEIHHFKFLISEHFISGITTQKNLIRFCVRILLTKRKKDEKIFYVLQRPEIWLNKNFEGGYLRTESWYTDLVELREKIAGYGQGLYLLAFGVYRYSQNPSTKVYQQYRFKLKHNQNYFYLQLYNQAVTYFNHLAA